MRKHSIRVDRRGYASLLALLSCSLVPAQELSVLQLADGIESRHSQTVDMEFVYDVTLSTGDAVAKSSDTFSIMRELNAGRSAPWRRWLKTAEFAEFGNEALLQQFCCFNGNEFRQFVRIYGEGKQHDATAYPTEQPELYDANAFDRILFSDINGNARYFDHNRRVFDPLMQNFSIGSIVDGKDDLKKYKIYVLVGKNASLNVEYLAEVTFPDFVITRFRASSLESDGPSLEFLVTNIGMHEGVAYPTAGKYQQNEFIGQSAFEYLFKVTDVRSMGTQDRSKWFPEWPPGAIGKDLVRNTFINVPPTEREIERAQLARIAQIAKKPRRSNLLRVLIVSLNLSIVFGVSYMVYRRWKRN